MTITQAIEKCRKWEITIDRETKNHPEIVVSIDGSELDSWHVLNMSLSAKEQRIKSADKCYEIIMFDIMSARSWMVSSPYYRDDVNDATVEELLQAGIDPQDVFYEFPIGGYLVGDPEFRHQLKEAIDSLWAELA